MQYIPNVVFALILVVGIGYFAQNIKQLIANIRLGKKPLVKGNPANAKAPIKKVAWVNVMMLFKPPIFRISCSPSRE